MLPYGTLWKLDHMLHPANPARRRTAALRRRQSLVLFFWGVFLVSIFLVPFHYAALRRMRIDIERELLGLAAPSVDLEQLQLSQRQALQRLRNWTSENRSGEFTETHETSSSAQANITADFSMAFYMHPSSRTRFDVVFAHPYIRALAGGGVDVLWPHLGDSSDALNASGSLGKLQKSPRARTLGEVAAGDATDVSKEAKCLIALRRDFLPVGPNNTRDKEKDDVIGALREALSTAKNLTRVDISHTSHLGNVEVTPNDVHSPTETALAALLLWLTGRHSNSDEQEEAIGRVLAPCQMTFSSFVQTSFDWKDTPGVSHSTVSIAAILHETEMAPQYLCLCSKHGVQPPVALVEPSSGVVTPLFFSDPAQLTTGVRTCAESCLHGGQRV